MAKVHPGSSSSSTTSTSAYQSRKLVKSSSVAADRSVVALTVWKKSLLLNCTGFTVFDSRGNLVFRVDNYAASNRAEIVLMDSAGTPLLTLRRKRLSLSGEHWLVYDGDSSRQPLLTARKQAHRCLARVSSGRSGVMYEMEGSYQQRSCAVYDAERRKVAEIKQKEPGVGGVPLGGDVFRLMVQPGMDTPTAMGLVILLDQMYSSSRI